MAFPTSPANNQTALVNGIVYQWNNTLGAWKRNGSINAATIGQLLLNSGQTSTSNNSGTLIVAGGAGISGNLYTGGIYITGSANGITFPDGTVQTTAGVAVDAFARSTANSASSNTVIIQGVDNTQNTNITIATNAATAAFAQANATAGGLTSANTRLTIIEGVDTAQNTRMSIIEGVDTAQNTRMSIIEGVDTAQNTRMSIIEGVNVTQNTNITIIQGVDLTQNTNITNADTKAQAAFDKANDAYTLANTANTVASSGGADSFARQTANAAFTQANTATTLAQAAFNKANNTSDAVLTSTVDTFTGNGSNTAFTLSVTPATINYTTAVVGGVTQPRSAYSVVGTTLTFTSAPANNQIIEVTTIGTSNTTLYTVNNIISPFLLMGA
jgi:hypothetical protein